MCPFSEYDVLQWVIQLAEVVVVFVSQGITNGSDMDSLCERFNETLDEQYSRNLSRYG